MYRPRDSSPIPTGPSGSTVRYVDPFRDRSGFARMTAEERRLLGVVNQRIAAKPTLPAVIDFLFDEMQHLIPCDRMSLAFVEEEGRRVIAHHVRTTYRAPLLVGGYAQDLNETSLGAVLEAGTPRIIGDLEQYVAEHPRSSSSRLLALEGVRSSLTCPLLVEGRVVGFMFRSSRERASFSRRHVELQMSISERLSQAVEKAWHIEQLEEANRAYLEMLGFVSHELKSPVASMVTDARLVADGYLGPVSDVQRAKLERFISKGDYLLDLVREYLDLARVEGNELQMNVTRGVRFEDEVVLPAIELVRAEIEAHGMSISVDCSQTPRLLVDCDSTLVKIVLVNLLANAVHYGREDGRIVVRVTASRERFSVRVWNEGVGFAATDIPKLFRRFSRLTTLGENEGARRRGTGLGLYSAWRIVQLHGGRIRAASQPGDWAEFRFDIPQPPPAPGNPNADSVAAR